jgi:hypothetical protein
MAVALVALFLSLGGVSYGLATGVIDSREIKNNTIRSADVRNGGVLGKDARADGIGGRAIKESTLGTVPSAFQAHGATHFVVVSDQGVQVRGRGTVSAARTAEGRYQVITDRDVRSCAYYATIGDPSAAQPVSGQVSVSSLGSNVNGVRIRTENDAGAPADRPFHLLVLC